MPKNKNMILDTAVKPFIYLMTLFIFIKDSFGSCKNHIAKPHLVRPNI